MRVLAPCGSSAVNSGDAVDPPAEETRGPLRLLGAADWESLRTLIADCRAEALRAPFPVDSEIYALHDRDEADPILAAGNLAAPCCVFGRDLGKDEVRFAQPQIGQAGKLVRRGLLSAAGRTAAAEDPLLEAALPFALLANTVPFKPPGNKAYCTEVKERFRPHIARLLGDCWLGNRVITLGTEAFFWFSPYVPDGQARTFWEQEDRYEREMDCVLRWREGTIEREKPLRVAPLPHPSPLNRKWLGAFPELLEKRLRPGECGEARLS